MRRWFISLLFLILYLPIGYISYQVNGEIDYIEYPTSTINIGEDLIVNHSPLPTSNDIYEADWNPNGTQCLMVGANGVIFGFDGAEFIDYSKLEYSNCDFRDIEWNNDGSEAIIVGSDSNKSNYAIVLKFDGVDLQEIDLPDKLSNLTSISWNPTDGSAFIVGSNNTVFKYNPTSGVEYIINLMDPSTYYTEVCWAPNGTYSLLTGGGTNEEGHFTICVAFYQNEFHTAWKYSGSTNPSYYKSVVWHPDGEYALVSSDNRVIRYDGTNTDLVDFIWGSNKMEWRPNHDYAIILHDYGVSYCDENSIIPQNSSGFDNVYYQLLGSCWNPSGSEAIIVGKWGKIFSHSEVGTYEISHRLVDNWGSYYRDLKAKWRPNGDEAIVLGYRNSYRMNSTSVEKIEGFSAYDASWKPDGSEIAIPMNNQTIALTSDFSYYEYIPYPEKEGGVLSISWHPSGEYFLFGGGRNGGEGFLFKYSDSGIEDLSIDWNESNIKTIEWSPDGSYAFICSEYSSKIYTGNEFEEVPDSIDHFTFLKDISFNPFNGNALITGRRGLHWWDYSHHLWEYDGSEYVELYRSDSGPRFQSAKWHPSGEFALITGSTVNSPQYSEEYTIWKYHDGVLLNISKKSKEIIDEILWNPNDGTGYILGSMGTILKYIPKNEAPVFSGVIPNISIDEDDIENATVEINMLNYFFDDEQHLRYRLVSLDDQSFFSGNVYVNRIEFNWTVANLYGQYRFKITAFDGNNQECDSNDFIVTINPTNDVPIIEDIWGIPVNSSMVIIHGEQGILKSGRVNASDMDDDPLLFSIYPQNENITLNPDNGFIVIDPGNGNVGNSSFNIRVTDINSTYQEIILKLFIQDKNDAPFNIQILEPNDGTIFNLTDSITFSGFCLDPDLENIASNESLTFKWFSNISGYLGEGEEMDNKFLHPGNHQIILTVLDSGGLSVQSTILITVIDNIFNSEDTILKINLVEPRNGTKVPTNYIMLKWSTDFILHDLVYYDIYIANGSEDFSLVGQINGTTEFLLEGLEDRMHYRWKVIPSFMGIEGISVEGEFCFDSYIGFVREYGIEVNGIQEYESNPGMIIEIRLNIYNTGNDLDSIELISNPPSGFKVEMDNKILLNGGGAQVVSIYINVSEDIEVGSYIIPIIATSSGGESIQYNITFNILDSEISDSKPRINFLIIIIPFVVLILIIIIVLIIYIRRRKSEERDEEISIDIVDDPISDDFLGYSNPVTSPLPDEVSDIEQVDVFSNWQKPVSISQNEEVPTE
jgi:hypothetical protein